ncbi:MAG: YcgN family cysteine cluster protein [Pseudomonadales bacterium]
MSFWEEKSLAEMTRDEWESLCDGCARCCLHKLEDEDTGEVFYTDVVCRYLEQSSCRCQEYQQRNTLVPNCVWLKPEDVEAFHWLPETCAYRRVAEGQPLAGWHPLISGRAESVLEAGIAVTHRCISETRVAEEDFEDRIIHWVQQ